ncbi:MAG: hypothetical protein ACYDB1_01105 [Acidiferrobacteraceae bacterium]
MTDQEKAAYIHSQVACALIEMEAMRAANQYREIQGCTPTYGEEAFRKIIENYPIHHNAVMSLFRD